MNYPILTPSNQVIAKSTLPPVYHPEHQNLHQVEGEELEAYRLPATADACSDPIENAEIYKI